MEQITYTLVSSAIASIVYPEWALYNLLGWFVGRFAFTLGYTLKGPQGRLVGALIMDLTMLISLVLMVMSVGVLVKWW